MSDYERKENTGALFNNATNKNASNIDRPIMSPEFFKCFE